VSWPDQKPRNRTITKGLVATVLAVQVFPFRPQLVAYKGLVNNPVSSLEAGSVVFHVQAWKRLAAASSGGFWSAGPETLSWAPGGTAVARPRKTPELKWLGGNEQTFVARFDGQRRRYGPDREEAVRRFEDDLAVWLGEQKTPTRPAGGSPVPQVLTVPGLCVRHLEGFLPTVGRSQGEHHRRDCRR